MWVAEIVFVEINQVQPQPVLYLALAEIVQVRLPVPVLRQIFRHMRRTKEYARHHRNPSLAAPR